MSDKTGTSAHPWHEGNERIAFADYIRMVAAKLVSQLPGSKWIIG